MVGGIPENCEMLNFYFEKVYLSPNIGGLGDSQWAKKHIFARGGEEGMIYTLCRFQKLKKYNHSCKNSEMLPE